MYRKETDYRFEKMRRLGHLLVFFCFLLDISNFLGNRLECVLVVLICALKLFARLVSSMNNSRGGSFYLVAFSAKAVRPSF
jgi:hypothetical protein